MTAPPLPATLAKLPEFLLAAYPAPALVRRSTEGAIENLSTSAVVDRVAEISLGLMSLGVGQGDRVAIICESRPEWLLTDLGAQTAGAIVVPVYPTLTPGQTHYILADAGPRVAVVSTSAHAAKVLEAQDELPALETIVVIDAGDLPAGRIAVRSFESLVAAGRAARESDPAMVGERQARIDAVRADDLATIIYTSGTTGQPKGVMLTHDNILSNVRSTMGAFPPIGPTDVGLTFLPLSHAFERTVLYLYLCNGVSVAFAESMETIARDLSQVAPTLLTGVPRFYEKLHSRILAGVQSASAVRRGIFAWAVRVGVARARARLAQRTVPLTTAIQWPLADALVFKKLRQRVGGNLRFFVSGSAPLAAPVAEFFYAAGLPIVEGYGLTETSPVLAVNPADAPRYGTVGHIIPGVEVKIADDGEILARGPNVMRGYYNRPSDTEAAIKDGWFYTGDIGHIDADGYLSITDRKKELIVTSGGKKIAPQPIEGQLKTDPLVGEVVVIGDRRNFAAALIVPDFARLERQARQAGITVAGREQLVADPRVRAWYQAVIDKVNGELGQFERIKKFVVLPREFTQEAGELTPTLKVKRKVVQEKLREVIEGLYGDS